MESDWPFDIDPLGVFDIEPEDIVPPGFFFVFGLAAMWLPVIGLLDIDPLDIWPPDICPLDIDPLDV